MGFAGCFLGEEEVDAVRRKENTRGPGDGAEVSAECPHLCLSRSGYTGAPCAPSLMKCNLSRRLFIRL